MGTMPADAELTTNAEAHLDEDRLRMLLERAETIASIGHYRLDLATGEVYVSPGLSVLGGGEQREYVSDVPSLLEPLMAPEEAARLAALRVAATRSGQSYSYETTIHPEDGGLRRLLVLAIPEFANDGRVRAFFGLVRDVTEERERERELNELTREYERAERLARMFHSYDDFRRDMVSASPMFYEIFGLEPGSGKLPVDQLFSAYESKDAQARGRARREAFKRAGAPLSVELSVVRANDGERRILAMDAEPEFAPDGSVVGQFSIVRDITELRRTELELSQTNRLFYRAQHLSRVGHFYDDFVAGEFRPSDTMYEIWGLEKPSKPITLEEFALRTHGSNTDEIENVLAIQAQIKRDRRPFLVEFTLKRPNDGETRHLRIESEADVDDEGRVVGSFGIVQDVTELRQTEHELRRTNRLLYRAQRLTNVGYCYDDFATGAFTASETVFAIYGVEKPQRAITFEDFAAIVYGDNEEEISRLRAIQGLLKSAPSTLFLEITINRPSDGRQRHLRLEAEPDYDERGRAVGAFTVIQDVTDVRHTERELSQTNRLFYRAQKLSGIGHFYDDYTTGELINSDTLYDIYGLEKPSHPITLQEFAALAHGEGTDDAALVMALQAGMKREPATNLVEFSIVRPNDGATRHLRIETEPDFDEKGRVRGAFGVLQDVTDLRRAERELRRREAFLEAAQKATLVAPYRLNVVTKRFTGSLLIRDFFGWTGEVPDFVPLQEVYDHMASEADVERAATSLAEATASRCAYSFEYSIRRRSDGALRHMLTRAEPELDESGEVIAFLGILQDVTAEVEARRDRERLAHRVERAQRIETLGFFAGGLAHEVRNVVQPLPLIAKRLRKLLEKGEYDKVLAALDSLELASERALTSVRGMLAYIGSERERIESVSLGALMEDTERFLRAAVRARLRFDVEPSARSAVLRVGRTGFLQVALNLAQNAVEAGGEDVTIAFRAHSLDNPRAAGAMIQAGRCIELNIEDDGPGIAPSALARIFEPFFSSKLDADGTGLGLALTQSMIARWRGEITVSSPPGQGAVFTIRLPYSEPDESASEPP